MLLFFLHLSQGKKLIFFLFQCHHWINDCHTEPGYRELLIHTDLCSSWKMNRLIFLTEHDYSGISNRLFFFWERRTVKFILMTVVKWDLEILMPFPSIMPSLCCHRYCFNLEDLIEYTVGTTMWKKTKSLPLKNLDSSRGCTVPSRSTDICM